MFDVGFWEVSIIGIIMLLVLGPERLPGVARTAGFWLGKMRKTIDDVKADIKKEIDAADMQDLKDVKDQISKASNSFQQETNKVKAKIQEQANKVEQDAKKLSGVVDAKAEQLVAESDTLSKDDAPKTTPESSPEIANDQHPHASNPDSGKINS